MLVIREQALDSIAAQAEADFAKAWVATARSENSPLSAAVRQRCDLKVARRGIDFARRYGIIGRYDLERFLYVYVELIGTERAGHAWALEILEDPTLSPSYKTDQLEGQFALLSAAGDENLG
jgi:hypothetical protein